MLVTGLLSVAVVVAACSKEEPAGANGSTSAKRGKINVSVYDRGNIAASEGTIENNRWTKWINENGPVDVSFTAIPRNNAKEKVNTLFSSGSAPDLLFEYSPEIKNPLYAQKQLMPIDDMINKYSTVYKKLLEQTPALKKAGLKADGKLYEFGKLNEAMPTNILVMRQDWLKKLNLQMPKTTEELYQVAKAFAERDPDGNGQKDTYGFNLGNNVLTYEIFGADILVSDAPYSMYAYKMENGVPVKSWSGDKAYADFAKRLVDEGIADKDFATDKNGAKARQAFLNGKLGIYAVQANSYPLWNQLWITDYATLKKSASEAELTVMAVPKSPDGQYMGRINNPVQMTAVVNADAKDPESVMKYVDFLSKPETGMTLTYGLEGVHWSKGANGCPVAIDPNKNKTEVDYKTLDFDMVFSVAAGGKCTYVASSFDGDKPEQKYAEDMYKQDLQQMDELIQQNAQYPSLTHHEHLPTVPSELLVDATNADKEIKSIWTKAILGGASYSTDKALTDVQVVWAKYNGKKIEEFYQNWYKNANDTTIMPKDIYGIVKDQSKTQDELLK